MWGGASRPSAAFIFAKLQPVVGTRAVLFYLNASGIILACDL